MLPTFNGQTDYRYGMAKEWAEKAQGWRKSPGGYIRNADGVALLQGGWPNVWYFNKTEILDWYTHQYTAFYDFGSMLDADGEAGRPLLLPVHGPDARRQWRMEALANAYDYAQILRGDPRRAQRVD